MKLLLVGGIVAVLLLPFAARFGTGARVLLAAAVVVGVAVAVRLP